MPDRQRATFEAAELAVVLSYYDLGVIESVTEFDRGSRRSPKVGLVSERGKFLLKRRVGQPSSQRRVRFTHRLQAHLEAAGFPLAKLIPTQDRTTTAVTLKSGIYELFEFVAGQPYRRSAAEARDAGVMLARFHEAVAGFAFAGPSAVPRGDYHDSSNVRTGLCGIGSTLRAHDSFSGDESELLSLVDHLLAHYDQAVQKVNGQGFESWPEQIIHSDWHPGNLLYRGQRVVAVIDYDASRLSRRVIDVANGALQFSLVGVDDPSRWPAEVDELRYRAFLAGYESLLPLLIAQRRCLPYLMGEALLAECVAPIRRTGTMGRWTGFRVLQMVRRKLSWLFSHADRLVEPAGGASEGNG